MTARAWFVAHDGAVTLTAVLVCGAGIAVAAHRSVPTLDRSALPLGMLAPPLLAMLAGLGVTSDLPMPRPGSSRVGWARTCWLATVATTAGAAGSLVGLAYPVPGLTAATVALTCLTYGSSVLLGRAALLSGAAVAVVLVADTRSFAAPGSESWSHPGWAAPALALAGGVGGLLYVVRGPRATVPFAG